MREPTKEQEEFTKASAKHQMEEVENIAYLILGLALKDDLNVFDVPYYTLQRARTLIEQAFKKVSFKDPKLMKARKAFLKVCLESMRKNIPAPETKEVKDETDVRDNRCEHLAHKIVELLLQEDLIFSDDNYFEKILENEESVPLTSAIEGYANRLDDKLLMVISRHWQVATEKLMGVPKERLTFSQLDAILKKV